MKKDLTQARLAIQTIPFIQVTIDRKVVNSMEKNAVHGGGKMTHLTPQANTPESEIYHSIELGLILIRHDPIPESVNIKNRKVSRNNAEHK